MGAVAGLRKIPRGAGPVGVALTAIDLWMRLPPRQRKLVMQMTRKHGPRVAKVVVAKAVASRTRPKPKP